MTMHSNWLWARWYTDVGYVQDEAQKSAGYGQDDETKLFMVSTMCRSCLCSRTV
ncbi:unnamed protein product [Toxocara canis]|uniref:N-acetyltransferase domain-containing protein n=1 Tax=Toxocara canis TaxID=6265 RepID=A0A183UKV8_TOXCA|nr:unnamed protein product [Toxocara canis]